MPIVESRCLDWRREHHMCPVGLRLSWRGATEPEWGSGANATEMVRSYIAACVTAGHRVELRARRGTRREVVVL